MIYKAAKAIAMPAMFSSFDAAELFRPIIVLIIIENCLQLILYVTDNLAVEEVDGSLSHCGILL